MTSTADTPEIGERRTFARRDAMDEAGTAGAVLDIDLRAIVANWRLLCARHPSGAVAGVVKADAYGLGAVPVATALQAAGCRHFFVALPEEALALRPIVPGAMVAVLGGLIPGSGPDYLAHDITPVLNSLTELEQWSALARQAGRRLPALLHIDTGMSRLGLSAAELGILHAQPERLAAIELRYVLTHMAASEVPDDPLNEHQRARFEAACRGLPVAPRSLANSSGIFLGPRWGSDLARPGAALYGINPTPGRTNPLQIPLRLRARVLTVRDVPAGQTVGYNATWRAARPSRIATAAIGYADGWHRALSNQAHAFFDENPVPLVGRVSMDLTTFDVTEQPGIVSGAWLELIGNRQTPDDIATLAGTNGYEILTALGRRIRRVYRSA